MIALNEAGSGAFYNQKQKLNSAAHPLQLYLKAHFLGARVTRAEAVAPAQMKIHFEGNGHAMSLEFEKGQLKATLEVPGRKTYRQNLALAPWPAPRSEAGGDSRVAPSPAGGAVDPVAPVDKKRLRLLDNIRQDIQSAQDWLARLGPLCLRLAENPNLWKKPQDLSTEDRALIDDEIKAGRLPPLSSESTGKALDTLFRHKKRAERKIQGGLTRLKKAEANVSSGVSARRTPGPMALNVAGSEAPRSKPAPRKKPGTWVHLRDELWARVGRSASENDELFRQSKDRDVWFHVRGGAGGHVWIPRGQPGFGSKHELADDLIFWGSQLALINSKSLKSGQAVVDHTERRYLRKIKGAPGHVEILRSQTLHVRLDEAFERRVMGRDG